MIVVPSPNGAGNCGGHIRKKYIKPIEVSQPHINILLVQDV